MHRDIWKSVLVLASRLQQLLSLVSSHHRLSAGSIRQDILPQCSSEVPRYVDTSAPSNRTLHDVIRRLKNLQMKKSTGMKTKLLIKTEFTAVLINLQNNLHFGEIYCFEQRAGYQMNLNAATRRTRRPSQISDNWQLILQTSFNHPWHATAKIPFKNSWIRIYNLDHLKNWTVCC